jgi:2,3-dihydroxybenzoate decarboxylase
MKGKIALEEAFSIPEALESFDPLSLAPKGVIGGDLVSNLLDIHGHRLQQMNENGVDLMLLSLTSAGCQGVPDRSKAEELARLANNHLSTEVLKNPQRFAGLAAVSMHDPEQAASEVRRCFTELKGFVGVLVNDFQSAGEDGNTMLFYDQPAYDPFWRECEAHNAPVYMHPRNSTPLIHQQMWAGRPQLDFSALGYANRVNMHLLGIITNGVLDRFPRLKIVVGHMGEHIPYDLYRIDHKLNRARFSKMGMRKDKLVRDYFGEQVFITTSGHFSTPALLCAMQEVGTDAICFSIDYPYESIPNGCTWWDEHVRDSINARDLVKIGRNNALRVFERLSGEPFGLQEFSTVEAGAGGLRVSEGEVEFGRYNKDYTKREERQVPGS